MNADALISPNNHSNMFAYCSNQPVIAIDPDGMEYLEYGKVTNSGGTHSLSDGRMPVTMFISYLRQGVDRKWQYNKGGSIIVTGIKRSERKKYYGIDCVGLYKRIMEWYFDPDSFDELTLITAGGRKGKNFCNVLDMKNYGLTDGLVYNIPFCTCCELDLPLGVAVFKFDPNRVDEDNEGWVHVGYYIGATEKGPHTIVHADSTANRVNYIQLENSSFTHYGYLKGIDYPIVE